MTLLRAAFLRRHTLELAGAALGVAVLLAHLLLYQPAQARMKRAERAAKDVGVLFDPTGSPALMPAPAARFIAANSLAETDAEAAARTGVLTAELLGEITGLASQSGLVVSATEPGVTLQQPEAVVARARLSARGSYPRFLAFLAALARSDRLLSVDQFALAGEDGDVTIDVWVSRHVLKRVPPRKAAR